MKCKDCGASLQTPAGEGLMLECVACALLLPDCTCGRRLDYLPLRWVHCLSCDRLFIAQVDTKKKGWRAGEV